jgi:hypothetical protein
MTAIAINPRLENDGFRTCSLFMNTFPHVKRILPHFSIPVSDDLYRYRRQA